ncbi:MAG: ornithine cyclodeaminase family protein [Roseobacter sp.]
MTRIFTEDQVRDAIGFDRHALSWVEQGYIWLRERTLCMPPVFHIDIDDQSAVDVKGAYVAGLDAFAIKMASGFYANHTMGLPSSSSVILLISTKTGFCDAVFLDNGYLMNLRTALAGAVAADYLARQDIATVGIVGAGVQARAQLQALTLVRNFDCVMIWGRRGERAAACAADIAKMTGAQVCVSDDLEAMVGQSDVVVTTTQTTEPLIKAEWIKPGTHITAMGSDLPGKQELDLDVLVEADLVVCDSIAQCEVGGELQHVDPAHLKRPPVALSDIICNAATGRSTSDDITICDMTGLGILDTAISVAASAKLSAD